MRGTHPALVVSSNHYNMKTNYVIVCPITSGGNNFSGYIPLNNYSIHGMVNSNS
ncbi:type II toxin-antitoxin system PemK/MazF family toxin [Amylolactobacillus amylophilus]|nr:MULTISPECIES: type II toxin-antitoxin system PemK/MazF family toxin [Amylolactobacillus]